MDMYIQLCEQCMPCVKDSHPFAKDILSRDSICVSD